MSIQKTKGPNIERLKELLRYEPDTGNFYWMIDRKAVKAGDLAGCCKREENRAILIDGEPYSPGHMAWLYMYGVKPVRLWHINGNVKDFSIKNLTDKRPEKEKIPLTQDKLKELLDYIKKRFEKTEMFKELQEYDKLAKDEDIVWYFKVKDSDKFDVLKNRKLIFSDEFEGDRLDKNKWLTNYYWGDKLLKDNYTVGNDLQAYTENENFEIQNSLLKIITKPRKKEGKVWSADGFKIKEFDYTSGIINTGESFRQKYGTFSAKVKLGNPSAKSAFWMLADKITPHVNVCRTGKGKVTFEYFASADKKAKSTIGSKYAKDFYIYTLEWTPDKLVWKVNDVEAFTQTTDVPQEPMYMVFSGGLDKPISGMTALPQK